MVGFKPQGARGTIIWPRNHAVDPRLLIKIGNGTYRIEQDGIAYQYGLVARHIPQCWKDIMVGKDFTW